MSPSPALTWDRVLAWRMNRQLLDPIGSPSVVEVVRRLCGVQAQVPSSAQLAIALRQREPRVGAVDEALAERLLLRTWAMRGTLHLLAPDEAGAYLSLMGAVRTWERPAWQRTFGINTADMAALIDAAAEALDDRVLDREQLIAEVIAKTGNRDLEEHLRSGWSAALKPLAWMGYLCNGPSSGGRVTFTRPDTWLPSWGGVPDPEEAARIAIPAYLRAHGPATMKTFDAWLARGASRKADLRSWFAALEDRLATVEVEGERCFVLAEDVAELESTAPSKTVRLLAGFDQFLLGAGTSDPRIVAPERRKEVSKTAGWISPVVLAGGRVAGVWELDGDAVTVRLFEEARDVIDQLEPEVDRVGAALGREMQLAYVTD